ncbi:MAG TPA: YfiR family protein [Noviherbaspirillum sp.]|uniref:YfiR family protein n=1 Tax=Noviherbaspirillum sp. TaxID=1926288 RepID=UPI002F9412E9
MRTPFDARAHFVARCLAAAAFMLPPGAASAQPVPEYELKVAFVYNFALFTEWPAHTLYEGGTLNVCVNPASPMRQPLSVLADRVVRGRKVALRAAAGADSLRPCHLLVLDGIDRDRWMQIRKTLGSASVLTVTDDDGIGRDGAMITLAMDGKRVVFDVDLSAARQAGLVLSSKLLRVARAVQ